MKRPSAGSSPSFNTPSLELFLGKGEAMQRLMDTLRRVAPTDVPVLIQGESGTGKELCVHMLLQLAGYRPEKLVKVSCPAIPSALLESELFGYEKGAFTGANQTKPGKVEQAHEGILFLDEIGSLDLSMQAKLLRFLQDSTFSRVGGHELQQIETRLVCTANQDLREEVAHGQFRLDLLYRINAVSLTVPPLRERAEDIPGLVDHFLRQHTTAYKTAPPPIPRSILTSLTRYSWPGNIRQLENMVRSYALLGALESLVPEESAFQPLLDVDVDEQTSLKSITARATRQLERHVILRTLKANGWNRRNTARRLKISYRSLLYKLSSFGALDGELSVPPPSRTASVPSGSPRLAQEQ